MTIRPRNDELAYQCNTHEGGEGELSPQNPQNDGITVVEGVNSDYHQSCSGAVGVEPMNGRWIMGDKLTSRGR